MGIIFYPGTDNFLLLATSLKTKLQKKTGYKPVFFTIYFISSLRAVSAKQSHRCYKDFPLRRNDALNYSCTGASPSAGASVDVLSGASVPSIGSEPSTPSSPSITSGSSS